MQDQGVFNAPDAVVTLSVDCSAPLFVHASVRNVGLASLPCGVNVAVFVDGSPLGAQVGTSSTSHALLPGQTETLSFALDALALSTQSYVAAIASDPKTRPFTNVVTTTTRRRPPKPLRELNAVASSRFDGLGFASWSASVRSLHGRPRTLRRSAGDVDGV